MSDPNKYKINNINSCITDYDKEESMCGHNSMMSTGKQNNHEIIKEIRKDIDKEIKKVKLDTSFKIGNHASASSCRC